MMKAATAESSYTLPIHAAVKDALRAKILKAMLLQVARKNTASQGG
jgi:hypothetical protein